MDSIADPRLSLLPKFGFSSGTDLNEYILRELARAHDVSNDSIELRRAICDWTSYYHLSHSRTLLLEPVRQRLQSPILEIGSGMGALTRSLGEAGFEVYATDVSETRRGIVSERCRDLPNVTVGDLAESAFQRHYGTVLLIGVLEYAPSNVSRRSGYESASDLLRLARSYLSDHGRLLLAIENQLGLQYLAGALEDHTGISYLGVEDRFEGSGVVTFGRRQLSQLLRDVGLLDQDWYFPFPDYKFPSCIFTARGLSEGFLLDPVPLLLRAQRLSTLRQEETRFSVSRAWGALARNGLLSDLSNSFLIDAGIVRTSDHDSDSALGWVLPPAGLRSDLGCVDVLSDQHGVLVHASHPAWSSKVRGRTQRALNKSTDIFWGTSSQVDTLQEGFDRGWSLETAASGWFLEWLGAIATRVGTRLSSLNGNFELPAAYLQAIPSNSYACEHSWMFGHLGEQMNSEISLVRLDWVVYRGLLHTLLQIRQTRFIGSALLGATVGDVLMRLGRGYLPDLDSSRMREVRQAEANLLSTRGHFEKSFRLADLETLCFDRSVLS